MGTVNTVTLFLKDESGEYSEAFTKSMTDLVQCKDGTALTEKLAEIDGKLPITQASGELPESLNFGQFLVKSDGKFYVGNSSNLPVAYSPDGGSGVLTVDMSAIQLKLLLDMCIKNGKLPDLPENVFVFLATSSESELEIRSGNWSTIHGIF